MPSCLVFESKEEGESVRYSLSPCRNALERSEIWFGKLCRFDARQEGLHLLTESVRMAREFLSGAEHLRGCRPGLARALAHAADVAGHLLSAAWRRRPSARWPRSARRRRPRSPTGWESDRRRHCMRCRSPDGGGGNRRSLPGHDEGGAFGF